MPEQSVKVVQEVYERFFGELTAPPLEADVPELFDPEIHLDHSRRVLNPATYDGYTGLLRALADVREAWEQFSTTPERFVAVGDQVLVTETVRGRGRGSGVEVVDGGASIYTLRDGRVLRVVFYPDRSEALEAVGLSA